MTAHRFRSLALEFPEVVEAAHMGHPDFRVRGRIFATLGLDGDWGMVKLTPEQQAEYIGKHPGIFRPASGAWGRGGATLVTLRQVKVPTARRALALAWCNTAPGTLVRAYAGD